MNLREDDMTDERIRDLLIPAWCGLMRLLYWMFVATAVCVVRGHAYRWTADVWHGDDLSMVWWRCERCQRGTVALVPPGEVSR